MKRTTIYEMRRDGWNDFFELHISKTDKDMRRHIEEVAKKEYWLDTVLPLDRTLGLVHPFISTEPCFAYCFLSEEHLGTKIVAHECLHVAMAHERFVFCYGMDYGDECGPHEERLAYYFGEALDGVYATLIEHGHCKPAAMLDRSM